MEYLRSTFMTVFDIDFWMTVLQKYTKTRKKKNENVEVHKTREKCKETYNT